MAIGIEFKVGIRPDRLGVDITLSKGLKSVTAPCDVAELDDLINKLGQAGALMADEVPKTLEVPARVYQTRDPDWLVSHKPELSICLRHPGFGWLSFALAPDEAMAIATRLAD